MNKVAVIGIAGVGKEYIRELIVESACNGMLVALVDFQGVLDREVLLPGTVDPTVTNRFPGHNFTTSIGSGTQLIPLEESVGEDFVYNEAWIQRLLRLGVTHAIVATPPLERARDFIHALAAEHIQVLVEKPLNAEMTRNPEGAINLVSVGYMYARGPTIDAPTGFYEARIIVPRPEDNSWRWNTGRNAILWDVGVHLLSLDLTQPLSDVLLTEEMFLATTRSGVRYVAAYANNLPEARYGFFVHAHWPIRLTMDWEEHFKAQLTRFLSDTPDHKRSWEVAQQVEAFARVLEANYG